MPIMIGLAAKARSGKDTVAAMLLEHPEVAAYALADPLKEGCQALFGLTDRETWSDETKELIIPDWGLSPRQMFQRAGTEWLRDHTADHWLMRAERQLNQPPSSAIDSSMPYKDTLIPDAAKWLAVKAFWGLSSEQIWNNSERNQVDFFWRLRPIEMFHMIKTYIDRDLPTYNRIRTQLIETRPIHTPSSRHSNLLGKKVLVVKDIRFENEAEYLRSHNGVIWHISRSLAEKVNPHSSEAGILINPLDFIIENNDTIEALRLKVNTGWSRLQV